jgi:aldehyde reductase
MAPNVPNVKLNNGNEIPIFGLGTWKSKPGEVTEAVKNAIDVGYRHIDGALVYQNEPEVGAAIQAKISEGVVKREDLFLTSKPWNTFHKPELVLPSLKQTLKDLGVEYLDLYLIHWPMGYKEGDVLFPQDENGKTLYSDADYVDTWKAMEELVGLGLVKSIGLSNFNKAQIERILAVATIPPAVNQVECHPYLAQRKLVEYCTSKGIAITGYSPLGSPDRPWAKPDDPKLVEDPKLVDLGKKYNKTAAQVVLRWLVQRGIIAIPKSVHKHRLEENISIFDFELSQEDMDYVYTFDKGTEGRALHLSWAADHPHYPFKDEF